MLSRLVERRPELNDTWSLFLSKPGGFSYTAGDYTELELDYPPRGGRRWFSLSSAPSEERLRITFRLPAPHSRFKARLMELKPGDEVRLAPAMGNFNLPRRPTPVLFVAIGIGVTPFRSMVSQLLAEGRMKDWDIVMLHAAVKNDFLFEDVFEPIGDNYRQIDTASIKLDEDRIKKLAPDHAERMVYFAGPEIITERLHADFLAAGHPPGRLRLSYFPGYKGISD